MIQIRIHGRGGQGVVTAAELISIAAFFDQKQSQAFPSFGVERTGAPIEAYARIDVKPIRTREQVQNPNFLIVQDASLIGSIDLTKGCDATTKVIINSAKDKKDLKINLPPKNIFVIDATKIALEELGRNIVNTVILGAFAKTSNLISLPALRKAIKQKFSYKGQEIVKKNTKAIERAFNNF